MLTGITTSFQIIVEVLTPVHIDGGGEAVLGIDAVVHENKIYIIDVDCVARLATTSGLAYNIDQLQADQFVEQLARKFSKLLDAHQHQHMPCKPYRLVARIVDKLTGSPIGLPTLNYIPASTIKGLLRTALIYALLDKVKEQVIDAAHRSITRINPGNARSIKSASAIVEELLLRGRKPHGRRSVFLFDAARLLRISEPSISRVGFELREFVRVDTASYTRVASRPVIAFAQGSSFFYSAEIMKIPASTYSSLQGLDWIRKLLEVDSVVSLDNIKEGLKVLSSTVIAYELSRLKSQKFGKYRDYLQRISRENGKSCYILRLGYGAGHASKTILPWLEKNAPRIAKELKAKLSQHYARLWDDRTTTITSSGLGVGWIRLCLAEQKTRR